MDNEQQTELLIELRRDVQNLVKAFDKVSNGKGFPRCVERGQKIKSLEENYRWLRNTFFGSAALTIIATICVAVYTYISKSPVH